MSLTVVCCDSPKQAGPAVPILLDSSDDLRGGNRVDGAEQNYQRRSSWEVAVVYTVRMLAVNVPNVSEPNEYQWFQVNTSLGTIILFSLGFLQKIGF